MESKREPTIITNIENRIQKVVFNRASKKNAINSQMYEDLTKILNDSANNDDVLGVVITGNGDFYSSGNDFKSLIINESLDIDREIEIVKKFIESLILYPKLLIAIVNGPAIGIAATTLGLFDIVYASNMAYFITPFCKLGLSPEGCASYTFPKIMGPSKAAEMLYHGEKLTANEALKIGFVSRVYQSDTIHEIWSNLSKICSLSKQSLIATKKLINKWDRNHLLQINKEELIELQKMYDNPDFIENIIKLTMHKNKM